MFEVSEEDIKAMKEAEERIINAETEQYKKDQEIIEIVKKQVSSNFFEQIEDELESSENWSNLRIVDNPTGDFQGNMIDEFKVWVDQYCSGDDCYSGYVYVELPNGKYLTWDYWM